MNSCMLRTRLRDAQILFLDIDADTRNREGRIAPQGRQNCIIPLGKWRSLGLIVSKFGKYVCRYPCMTLKTRPLLSKMPAMGYVTEKCIIWVYTLSQAMGTKRLNCRSLDADIDQLQTLFM